MPCISLPKLYHTAELFYLLVKIMFSHFRNLDTVTKTRHKETPNLENMQVIFPKNSFISTLIDFFLVHQLFTRKHLQLFFFFETLPITKMIPVPNTMSWLCIVEEYFHSIQHQDTTQTMSQSQILFFHV